MNFLDNLQVGDRVTIHEHYTGPVGISQVKTVSKKKVVLESGSEWALPSGRMWGFGNTAWYTGRYIARESPGDSKIIQRKRDERRIRDADWKTISDEVIHQIAALLPN